VLYPSRNLLPLLSLLPRIFCACYCQGQVPQAKMAGHSHARPPRPQQPKSRRDLVIPSPVLPFGGGEHPRRNCGPPIERARDASVQPGIHPSGPILPAAASPYLTPGKHAFHLASVDHAVSRVGTTTERAFPNGSVGLGTPATQQNLVFDLVGLDEPPVDADASRSACRPTRQPSR